MKAARLRQRARIASIASLPSTGLTGQRLPAWNAALGQWRCNLAPRPSSPSCENATSLSVESLAIDRTALSTLADNTLAMSWYDECLRSMESSVAR